MPVSLIELKNPFLNLNPGRREPLARQPSGYCGLLTMVFSLLCHKDRPGTLLFYKGLVQIFALISSL